MKQRIVPALLAFGLVATACSGSDGATPPGSDEPGTTEAEAPDDTPPGTDPDGTAPDGTDPDDPPGGDGPTGPVGFAPAALRQFDECQAFLDYVHTEGAERVGPYGFGDDGWFGPVILDDTIALDEAEAGDVAAEAEPADQAPAEPVPAPAETSGPVLDEPDGGDDGTFSTTNVQVAGVDEPDIVKTDGDRILAVAGGRLHHVDVADDGTAGTARGSVDLTTTDGTTYTYGQEILVHGDRAFVIGRGEGGFDVPLPVPEPVEPAVPVIDQPATVDLDADAEAGSAGDATSREAPPADDGDVPAEEIEPVDPVEPVVEPEPLPEPLPPAPGPVVFGPMTVIHEVDLSDPDALTIVNTLTVEGHYVSARAIGETARVAITSPPQDLGFLYPSNPGSEDRATEFNRDLVAASTVEDWIPSFELTGANPTTGALVDCAGIHAPAEFSGFDMLSILTVDLAGPLTDPTADTTSVMATGDTVYASQDRMYVTTNVWLPPTIDEQQRGIWEEEYETGIHRFSIAGDGPAAYEASGSVDGHLLNQFSMHDRDGTFFVATTTGSPWGGTDSVSQIVALARNGDRLEQIGIVGGLGETERIFSVRYVGDVAYVVTFRQTDPFYVVDIADPRAMRTVGELKIPGFSSYLHPLSDALVLGVGQDATDEGRTLGTKVSLFDVGDPANPIELDVWTLPNAQSDAEFDHRAFLWWAPTNTAVLPLTSWTDQFSGAVVLEVTADGITERGRITQEEPTVEPTGQTDCDVVDPDQIGLTEADGDPFWILQEPGSRLQLCGPNDAGGADGYFCDVIPVADIDDWFFTGDGQRPVTEILGVDPQGGEVDRIEWCWRDDVGFDWERQIRRTMVIDESLWTLSEGRLQANDLTTLDTTGVVEL